MPSLEKKVMLRELLKKIENRPYLFVTQFKQLASGDMSTFRRGLEKASDGCVVVKNTLAKKAFEQLGVGDIGKLLDGQILVAVCRDEPQKLSKILVEFAKEKEGIFKIRGGAVDGKAVEDSYIKALAKLPSKHELLTQVVVGVKSPITGFVLSLNALLRSFVVVLNQVAIKKQESASA